MNNGQKSVTDISSLSPTSQRKVRVAFFIAALSDLAARDIARSPGKLVVAGLISCFTSSLLVLLYTAAYYRLSSSDAAKEGQKTLKDAFRRKHLPAQYAACVVLPKDDRNVAYISTGKLFRVTAREIGGNLGRAALHAITDRLDFVRIDPLAELEIRPLVNEAGL